MKQFWNLSSHYENPLFTTDLHPGSADRFYHRHMVFWVCSNWESRQCLQQPLQQPLVDRPDGDNLGVRGPHSNHSRRTTFQHPGCGCGVTSTCPDHLIGFRPLGQLSWSERARIGRSPDAESHSGLFGWHRVHPKNPWGKPHFCQSATIGFSLSVWQASDGKWPVFSANPLGFRRCLPLPDFTESKCTESIHRLCLS